MNNKEKFEFISAVISTDAELRDAYARMIENEGLSASDAVKRLINQFPDKFKSENKNVSEKDLDGIESYHHAPTDRPHLKIGSTELLFTEKVKSMVGVDTLTTFVDRIEATAKTGSDMALIATEAALSKAISTCLLKMGSNDSSIRIVLIRRSTVSKYTVFDVVTLHSGEHCELPIGYYIAQDNTSIANEVGYQNIQVSAEKSDEILKVCFSKCDKELRGYDGAIFDQNSESFIEKPTHQSSGAQLKYVAAKGTEKSDNSVTICSEELCEVIDKKDFDIHREINKLITQINNSMPTEIWKKLKVAGAEDWETALFYSHEYFTKLFENYKSKGGNKHYGNDK